MSVISCEAIACETSVPFIRMTSFRGNARDLATLNQGSKFGWVNTRQ